MRLGAAVALLVLGLPAAAQPVTFNKDVAPILFHYCAPCHRPGEAGPFSLLTYEDARRRAALIARVTRQRYMPPWPPEPGYGDFAGARRLSAAQIDVVQRWVSTGMAEGEAKDLPARPAFTDGWQLGEPDLVLHMRRPYQLEAEGRDVFRNFVLPVALTGTKYIRAMELRPGDKRVVHHANLIVDSSRLLRARDGQDGQPGFAGMDVETEATGEFDPGSNFLFWKPGSPPEEEPDAMAWKLDPGSDLVVNLHLRPSGKPETIEVTVGIYFAKQPPTKFPMLLQLEHDGAIDIPPGAADFEVTDHLTLPIAVDVLAIYPHAHYLGKKVEAWADLPDGRRRWLLKIGDWDINWQATYTYRQPVALAAGTTIRMRVTYDNTAINPRNPNQPPRRVMGGNRSEDEMGHVWLQVLPHETGDIDPRLLLQQALMRRRIEKYPADFEAHFNLGAALQAAGKPAESLPYLRKAVAIRPSSATAHNNLAVSLLETEQVREAIGEFRRSLALDPEYRNARYNLGRALAANGDTPAALAEVLAYLRDVPNDAAAHDFAGRLLAAMNKSAEAVEQFRQAVALQPVNSGMQTNLGVALAIAGDLQGAITAFEAALKIDPSNQVARENLEKARK